MFISLKSLKKKLALIKLVFSPALCNKITKEYFQKTHAALDAFALAGGCHCFPKIPNCKVLAKIKHVKPQKLHTSIFEGKTIVFN